jgi:hypothetical protein
MSTRFSPSRAQDDVIGAIRLPTTTLSIIASIVAILAAIISFWIINDQIPGILCAASDFFACGSGFLMGNTFRLRDVRARAGYQARKAKSSPVETLSLLPPQYVVAARMRVARRGVYTSMIMLLGAFFTIAYTQDTAKPIAAIAILGLVSSTICYLCGMWTRPLD